MSGALLNPNERFPYMNIYGVYIKCGKSERLKQKFFNVIPLLYPECIDVAFPVTHDYITNRHFTYGVQVLEAKSFYNHFSHQECYPWHVSEIAIQVPYGNIDDWGTRSWNWRVMTARTLRAIWHGARLIKNPTPTQRGYVNLGIPFIPLNKDPDKMNDNELYDYVEIVLSSLSGQIWVMDRQFVTPHVHCS